MLTQSLWPDSSREPGKNVLHEHLSFRTKHTDLGWDFIGSSS